MVVKIYLGTHTSPLPCLIDMTLKPTVGLFQSITQGGGCFPAQLPQEADIQQFAGGAVRFAAVENYFSLKAHHLSCPGHLRLVKPAHHPGDDMAVFRVKVVISGLVVL